MSFPLITIGITSYNAVDSVERAIQSALIQEWDNIDIIVVDDCSNDGTYDLLRTIASVHTELRIFQNNKNSGVAVSRNRIIEEANGKFIAFFDDDDESISDRLAQQYKRITQYEENFANGAHVICHTARLQIYPDGEKRLEQTMGTNEQARAPNGRIVARRILTGQPVNGVFGSTATCSQMARTSVFRELNGFDPEFFRSEDTDFNVRLAIEGGHFVGISTPLVLQTMTLTDDKSIMDERFYALQLIRKHKNYINSVSSYTACYGWIDAKYEFLSGKKIRFVKKLIWLFFYHPIFVLKRIYWALPNFGFNKRFSKFYDG